MRVAWASPRVQAALIALVVALLLLPFAGKPLHIDDPLFVWAGEALAADPLHPYAASVNWYGHTQPMHEMMWNPPAAAYLVALVAALFGTGEVALHLAFLVPAIVFVVATYFLAARWCRRPWLATLAAALSPAFLVSATSVMADVTMAALFVSSLLAWVDGIDRPRRGRLLLGGALAGLCILSKYAGLAVLPLMAFHALSRRAPPRDWLSALLVPLLMLGAYEIAMHAQWGTWQIALAGRAAGPEAPRSAVDVALVALAFLGGAALGAVGLLLLSVRPRVLAFAAGATGIAVALVLAARWDALQVPGEPSERTLVVGLELASLAGAGLTAVALAARRIARARSPVEWLLGLWLAEVLVFAACLNWSTTARAFLAGAPALAILACRCLEAEIPDLGRGRRAAVASALALTAAISLVLNVADQEIARSAKRAAEELVGRDAWFQGHWGFQYYAQRAGGRPFELGEQDADSSRPGDRLILPMLNANVHPVSEAQYPTVRVERHALHAPITTLGRSANAGFYGSVFGVLPFGCGFSEPAAYWVLERR